MGRRVWGMKVAVTKDEREQRAAASQFEVRRMMDTLEETLVVVMGGGVSVGCVV